MSKYTIKFNGTGGRCFGVIYKDDVEVWRDKPWPDDGSAEQAGYEKLKEMTTHRAEFEGCRPNAKSLEPG